MLHVGTMSIYIYIYIYSPVLRYKHFLFSEYPKKKWQRILSKFYLRMFLYLKYYR